MRTWISDNYDIGKVIELYTSAPVRIARSSKLAFLVSPKPGALTAQTYISCQLEKSEEKPSNKRIETEPTLTPARNLLRIRVANASLSKSSVTMSRGFFFCWSKRINHWHQNVIEVITNKHQPWAKKNKQIAIEVSTTQHQPTNL